MPAKLTKKGDALVLDLSSARGLEFREGLDKIREVPGRRYSPDDKTWSVPADVPTAERVIHSIEPEVDPALQEWLKAERVRYTDALTTPLPTDATLVGPLADVLYPYQRAFVDLAARKRAIINADDMGLGKTLQALGVTSEFEARHGQSGAKLIVCPNSVKGVWAREIVKWLGSSEPHQIIDGGSPASRHKQLLRAIQEDAYCIVNYEQLRVKKETFTVQHRDGGSSKRSIEVLKEPLFELPFLAAAEPSLDDLDPRTIMRARTSKHRKPWFMAVGDEIHRAKNRRASQTKGLHRTDGVLKLAATGTPIQNTPDELWSILHWLFPEEYTSFWDFYETYVDYTEGYWGKVIVGVKNPDKLRFELRDRLVRRTKDQVLDLPPKTRVTVPVELSAAETKLYNEVLEQAWIDLQNETNGNDVLADALEKGDLSALLKVPNGAARMVRLQQLLEHPANIDATKHRLTAKMDACEEIILDNRHIQHGVFVKFKLTASIFAERLREHGLKVGVYTGDTDPKLRTQLEDEFQAGDIDVMVGTIDAMREGITLTAASTGHFLTRAWVPAWNEQAEDRFHRNGQQNAVTIYIYECPGTVDDGKVKPANDTKSRIVKAVIPKDDVKEAVHK